MTIAIRRSRDGAGGSGGRHKAALARLHSARSLNRSQGCTAGCRGSSLAPTGRRSFYEQINEVFRACGKSVAKLMPAGPGKTAAMRALSDTRMKCNQAVALKGRF